MKTNFNNLEDINKKTPFKVPENYFLKFNEEIMNKLPEKEIYIPRTVTMWDKVKPWVYMAAMFAAFYVTLQFLTKDNTLNDVTNSNKIAETQQQTAIKTPATDKYWSNVYITEDEFYQYLEDQITEEGYYEYIYEQMDPSIDM